MLIVSGVVVLVAGCALVRPDRAIRVATNAISHTLCSEVFLAGRDSGTTYDQVLRPEPGIRLSDLALRYTIDTGRREVRTTFARLFEARALYREGVGCVSLHGSAPGDDSAADAIPAQRAPSSIALLPDLAGPALVEPADPRLREALDRAFAEPDHRPYRWTKAVVVVHDGRIVAERYAPGYGIDTPLWGHSMTKSVVNALVGILVRDGALSTAQTGVAPAWRGNDDPRHVITINSCGWRADCRGTNTPAAGTPRRACGTSSATWRRSRNAGGRRRLPEPALELQQSRIHHPVAPHS